LHNFTGLVHVISSSITAPQQTRRKARASGTCSPARAFDGP
jgi:hypothetical protein